MPRPTTVRLSILHPRYVAHPKSIPGWSLTGPIARYGQGLEFDCPTHLDGICRVRLWLAKPHDGGGDLPAEPLLYEHRGAVLKTHPDDAPEGIFEWLTLSPGVDIPGCFSGYIHEGHLTVLRDYSRGGEQAL